MTNLDKEYGEIISEYCNFKHGEHDQRGIPADIEGISKDKIIVRELENFGHTYKKPQGVLKMNILE